jgi:hypothetical protein
MRKQMLDQRLVLGKPSIAKLTLVAQLQMHRPPMHVQRIPSHIRVRTLIAGEHPLTNVARHMHLEQILLRVHLRTNLALVLLQLITVLGHVPLYVHIRFTPFLTNVALKQAFAVDPLVGAQVHLVLEPARTARMVTMKWPIVRMGESVYL